MYFMWGGETKMDSAMFFLTHLSLMLIMSFIFSNYIFNKIDNKCVQYVNKKIKRKYNNEK